MSRVFLPETLLSLQTETHTYAAVLKLRKPIAALMALTRLKEQGVEEPGLLPSDFPHCRAWG